MGKNITIAMHMDKATENTIHFAENTLNEFMPEKLGGLYVQKFLLEQSNYRGGEIVVEFGNNGGDVKFMPAKDGVKKNVVLFEESVADDFHAKRIGKIYVPKTTLAEIEYAGDALYVSIKAEFSVVEK